MLSLTSEYQGTILSIYLKGRIDSKNYKEAEELLAGQYEEKQISELILDFTELSYLSSAGLRVILHLKKKFSNTKIVNVSAEVYDIFDMTGFTEMMEISKAYRKLDVSGCEIIGKGSNGTVYRYTEDIVVKVYKNNDALADIHRERELARTALVLGVNTAIPYDVVQVGEHYGSVFELLSAKNITQLILEDPDNMDHYIKIFCDLLKTIHETQVKPGILPQAKKQYQKYAEFLENHIDAEDREKLMRQIKAVPDSCMMIHGDYHTGNVHYTNEEAILIDMDTLAVGNPVFEFASVFLTYIGFNELDPESSNKYMKIDKKTGEKIWDLIVKNYFAGCNPDDLSRNVDKFRVLAYTRFLRRTIRRTSGAEADIAYLKEKLKEALDKVDSLAI